MARKSRGEAEAIFCEKGVAAAPSLRGTTA
jgi:hypothetical protein